MAGWITEVDPAVLGVKGSLFEDSNEGPDALNFGELFTFMRSAGRRILDTANQQLFQGPVAECLAPDPYADPENTAPEARPIIGVVGSELHEYAHMSEMLGRWIASEGYNLLTFCSPGVSHALARSFVLTPERAGRSLGIEEISTDYDRQVPEYVDLPVRVPTTTCRVCCDRAKSVFYSTAHLVIVLPGASEQHVDAPCRLPTIVWEEHDGAGRTDMKRAFRIHKFAELSRYVSRILLDELSDRAASDPSDQEESGDDFELVEGQEPF